MRSTAFEAVAVGSDSVKPEPGGMEQSMVVLLVMCEICLAYNSVLPVHILYALGSCEVSITLTGGFGAHC